MAFSSSVGLRWLFHIGRRSWYDDSTSCIAIRATRMMREFKFEDEMHTTLACVPMAVRRKLDRVGVKIGLEQWKALGRGERLAICHLPVDRHEEREALRLFINEAVRRARGEEPRTLGEAPRAVA